MAREFLFYIENVQFDGQTGRIYLHGHDENNERYQTVLDPILHYNLPFSDTTLEYMQNEAQLYVTNWANVGKPIPIIEEDTEMPIDHQLNIKEESMMYSKGAADREKNTSQDN